MVNTSSLISNFSDLSKLRNRGRLLASDMAFAHIFVKQQSSRGYN